MQAWASDPDAATVLLKPDLLARIEAKIEALGIREMRMGWRNDQLVMLVDFGRNLFELSQRKAVDFYRDAEQAVPAVAAVIPQTVRLIQNHE